VILHLKLQTDIDISQAACVEPSHADMACQLHQAHSRLTGGWQLQGPSNTSHRESVPYSVAHITSEPHRATRLSTTQDGTAHDRMGQQAEHRRCAWGVRV